MAFVYDGACSFRAESSEKTPKRQNNHPIPLGSSKMKISSKLSLGCAMVALAAGTAYADFTPNAQDSSGHAIRDGSGNCVVTSGAVLPECEGARPAAPAPAPSAPVEPTPSAPAAPTPAPEPARPAPSSVRQAIVIQADALFDFDKSVVRPDGKRAIDEALAKLGG